MPETSNWCYQWRSCGGLNHVTANDIRIASEHAKFVLHLPRDCMRHALVGSYQNSWYLQSFGMGGGNLIPREALKYNLISEITSNEQLLVRAKKLALG